MTAALPAVARGPRAGTGPAFMSVETGVVRMGVGRGRGKFGVSMGPWGDPDAYSLAERKYSVRGGSDRLDGEFGLSRLGPCSATAARVEYNLRRIWMCWHTGIPRKVIVSKKPT